MPEGHHTATPYLIIKGAAKAIEFYKRAFGAEEIVRMTRPDGRVGHAEIKIGDSPIRTSSHEERAALTRKMKCRFTLPLILREPMFSESRPARPLISPTNG